MKKIILDILGIIILGLIIGSFLNVCIYRIPKKESIIFPPSHCTSCDESLRPWDLIPILSYVFNRGRCRYCGEKISPQYPIIEFLNGLIYLLLYLKYGLTITFIKYALLASLLIVISFIDLKLQIIPDRLNIFTLILGILFLLIEMDFSSALNSILGLLVGGGIFLLIAIITNGAMGGGDIKLMGALGLFLGWKYILMVTLISFIIGAIASIVLMALGIKGRKDFIPFGPFISISGLIVMIYGSEILMWYLYRNI